MLVNGIYMSHCADIQQHTTSRAYWAILAVWYFAAKVRKKMHKKCFSSPFFTIFAGENEKVSG